jgi:hypothetical protein
MKFLVTMVMPSKSGALVHQVLFSHEAESLDDFADEISKCDFVIGDEIFRDNVTGRHYPAGKLILNTTWIGKVKLFHDPSA